MNDDLHRHLDGELERDSLSDRGQAEAEAWDRLLDAFRVGAPSGSAPPWLEDRVMAEIETLPTPGVARRALAWVLKPREVRVSPLGLGLAAAAVVALLFIRAAFPGAGPSMPATQATGGPDSDAAPTVYVQFLVEVPGARSVAVGGDFDAWEGTNTLADPDGDGVWSGRVAVRPGVYAYMFLVDGSEWVTDPSAERYAEDGFGNRNAVLAVAAPAT
jgi:hypothetical protein